LNIWKRLDYIPSILFAAVLAVVTTVFAQEPVRFEPLTIQEQGSFAIGARLLAPRWQEAHDLYESV
jgi:hypothetical protein